MVYIKHLEKLADFSKVEAVESKKLPFEITQQIQRYLREILTFNDEFLAEDLNEAYTLQTYTNQEKPSHKSELNNGKFWEYLTKNSIVKMLGKPDVRFIRYTDIDKNLLIPGSYKFQILDIKLIEELLERIKSGEEKIQKIDEVIQVENYRSSKVEFDRQNAVLRYKTLSHKFQKGIMGDPLKLKLFKRLWDSRLHIRKGKKIVVGSALDHIALAVDLGIAQERHSYELNKGLRDKFDQLVKDVKRPLKKKGFPLEIERKNGVQLVIVEK